MSRVSFSPRIEKDRIERKMEELLNEAKRCGFFADVIADAEWFEREGYTWDVALAMSCKCWYS